MKTIYFDCFSGVSGDMILGALIDAGLDIGELKAELAKLNVSGYKISAEKTARNSVAGTKFNVEVSGEHHAKRRLQDIVEIIDRSTLNDDVKESSKKTFRNLAVVEAGIHGESVDEIHFHEVGGLDSIVDVIGTFIGIKKLGIEAVYSSKVHLGTGFVQSRHGILPIPAPATLSVLKGVPVYSTGINAELATPTGAAILVTLSGAFGNMPRMKIEKIGYGAGSRELEIPNLLRVYLGEVDGSGYIEENLVMVETNIDDMNPEFFDYVSNVLLANGSLDVFMTPIYMKKNRPATMLSVLTEQDKLDEVLSTIFAETTTLGVRVNHLERKRLDREFVRVETMYGLITVKVSKIEDWIKNVTPEYEECKTVAQKEGVPLKDVYDEVKRAAHLALFT
ncbi:MAG: nickel pincer cofactor biosynthesis protein LarC [Dehalococcoidales bacterium]|jgi:hypothetical protein|nr:nickel pincer cofactor biosynthesis protein LarC [Dehalococcoidales bacterium]